jgi:hypothetical protein
LVLPPLNLTNGFSFQFWKIFFSMPYCSKFAGMKKMAISLLLFLVLQLPMLLMGQCSICTKTAQQMGEGPAKALNGGILYLAAMPFIVFGYITYRWWQSNKQE